MIEALDLALEQGIHADPDDDARFEVYADWLTAQGNPRGELAAIQLARARADSPELAERESALLEQHAEQFRGVHRTRFTAWLDDLCILQYKAGFWRSLSFGGSHEELSMVLAHPSARLLHTLRIHAIDDYASDFAPAIAALANTRPSLGALRELRIGDMPEGQDALVGFGERSCTNLDALAEPYPRLATLRLLCPNFDLGEREFVGLRWLDARMGASAASLAALGRARLPSLEALELGFETSPEEDAMYPELAWPEDALDELLAAIDTRMPALRQIRIWPMPHTLDHPLIQRLSDMPRIEIVDWDDVEDSSGAYDL